MTDHVDPRIEAAAIALYVDIDRRDRTPSMWPSVKPRWQESYRRNATAALAAADKAAPDVLVEDSWIPVAELPAVLGNFMRLSDQYAQDAKAMYARAEAAEAKIAAVRELAGEWESSAGPGSRNEDVLGKQVVSVEFAVKHIRAALDGTA